jgi:hypothetical protein
LEQTLGTLYLNNAKEYNTIVIINFFRVTKQRNAAIRKRGTRPINRSAGLAPLWFGLALRIYPPIMLFVWFGASVPT